MAYSNLAHQIIICFRLVNHLNNIHFKSLGKIQKTLIILLIQNNFFFSKRDLRFYCTKDEKAIKNGEN